MADVVLSDVVEYHKYLPSYRSLLSPNARYDYKTHLLIPLTQLEINGIVAKFQKIQQATKSKSLKMKYRSLLSDVSMKAQRMYLTKRPQLPHTLAATRVLWNRCVSFSQLPIEIQALVFDYLDDPTLYLNCMLTSRSMYLAVKPYLYRSVSFTSTYRFAQFVSCLRLNSSLGLYVVSVDLSNIKSGYIENDDDRSETGDQDENSDDGLNDLLCNTLAGWRDWKYKNNPLYALHPAPAVPLTKVHSSVSIQSQNSLKRIKISKYFKRRRSHSENPVQIVSNVQAQTQAHIHAQTQTQGHAQAHHHAQTQYLSHMHTHLSHFVHFQNSSYAHPKINKFLLNYAQSKDVPVGYVVHLINMCPNLKSANFANLTFSTDYRIKPAYVRQYQRYDLMNNFPKNMRPTLEEIGPLQVLYNMSSPFWRHNLSKFGNDGQYGGDGKYGNELGKFGDDLRSSASSVFSLGTLTKPILKYNSLLPPLGPPVAELTYLTRGDKQVFLSDLNLRAINSTHLESISPEEIFTSLGKSCCQLRSVNMLSMIWINMRLVRNFLVEILSGSLLTRLIDGKERIVYNGRSFEISNDPAPEAGTKMADSEASNLKELDLSNSGMYKNLGWAKKIDFSTYDGQKVIYRILNEEVISDFEEYVIRERIRRGRPGENYFS